MLSFVSLLRKTRLFLIEFQRNSFHLVCLSAHPDSLHAELVPLESDEVSTGAGILQHQTWEDLARLLGTSDRCPGIPGKGVGIFKLPVFVGSFGVSGISDSFSLTA